MSLISFIPTTGTGGGLGPVGFDAPTSVLTLAPGVTVNLSALDDRDLADLEDEPPFTDMFGDPIN